MTGRSAWLLCSTVLIWCVSQFLERWLGLVDPRVTSALQFFSVLCQVLHCSQ